ncbi:MAG: tetratricopeptide repeat protein [Pirellulaceae bacterium]|nr:tetratricopeptide repeat protein [Pirellulaceae bacterium]
MNQPSNNIQPMQIIALLLVVGGGGLVASWGIKELMVEPSSDSTPPAKVELPSPKPAAKPSEDAPAMVRDPETGALSLASPLTASVILPRVPLAVAPDKLEKECENFVERLVQKLPDNTLALNLAAMYYSQTQQTTRADELWQKCVKSAPKDPLIYHNWSTNAIHRGDSEQALEILDAAQKGGIEDVQLLYQRCIALSNLGRDEEVETVLAGNLANSQMNGSLWLQLGLSQLKLGKHQLASESLLKARADGILNKPLLNGLISCSARLKDRESAEKYRKELESLEEKVTDFGQTEFEARSETRVKTFSIGILGEAIEVYRLAGLLDDAEQTALRVLLLNPDLAEVYEILAKIYAEKKEPANQLAVLERLTEFQPGFLLNYLLMAKAASMSGDSAKAEALIKLTIAMGPEDRTSWIAMAEFFLEQNKPKKAIYYLRRAIELSPEESAGYVLLARALHMTGQESEAREAEIEARRLAKIPTVRANP